MVVSHYRIEGEIGRGGPSNLKKLIVFEGGRVPQDTRGQFREVLNWYDTHLGVVKQ